MSEEFRSWWAKNHPLDWWASERGGIPLDHKTRLLVWDLAQKAFEAARTQNGKDTIR